MTMLEKMARATYANWIEGVEDLEPAWDALPESHRDRLIRCQTAALQAIREPDEAMCVAACRTEGVARRFTAMIDHVLSERP